MQVTIRTEWPEVVVKCISNMDVLGSVNERTDALSIDYRNDFQYREVAAWLAAALACGLILSGGIER